MKRLLIVLVVLGSALALSGCDGGDDGSNDSVNDGTALNDATDTNDGTNYVAPYEVCAQHENDATACNQERGCHPLLIEKCKKDEQGRCVYFVQDHWCLPAYAPQEFEGYIPAVVSVPSEDGTDIYSCHDTRIESCSVPLQAGGSSASDTYSSYPSFKPSMTQCFERKSRGECLIGIAPANPCLWLDEGAILGRYDSGQCIEEKTLQPQCVEGTVITSDEYPFFPNSSTIYIDTATGTSNWPEPHVFTVYGQEDAFLYVPKIIPPKPDDGDGILVTVMLVPKSWEDGFLYVGHCGEESPESQCSCTLDGTDATGT